MWQLLEIFSKQLLWSGWGRSVALSLRKKSCPNSLGHRQNGGAFSHLNPVARSKPNAASISGLFFHLRGPLRLPARCYLTKLAGQSAKEPGAGDEREPGWDLAGLAGPPGGQREAPSSRFQGGLQFTHTSANSLRRASSP